MARFHRSPLLHFLAAGALFASLRAPLVALVSDETRPDRVADESLRRVVIDATRVDELRQGFVAQRSRAPDRLELERLVETAIDEELLAREARRQGLDVGDAGIEARLAQKMIFLEADELGGAGVDRVRSLAERARALGLDRDDLVVRRILAEKLRLAASELTPDERPGAGDLEHAYAARAETLREPERRSVVHVFFSRDTRGDRARHDADALLTALADGTADARSGDAFPLGQAFERGTRDDLVRRFGGDFGERVFALEVGRWSPPIESAYGIHLVRVDASVPGAIPAFEAVQERIRRELEAERRDRKVAALLARLRARYEVTIEWTREGEK